MKHQKIVTLVILMVFSINLAISSTSTTKRYAGFRSSSYGPKGSFPQPEYWSKVCKQIAGKFENTAPAGVWIVSTIWDGGECHFHFPHPGNGQDYDHISFSNTDKHEPYLDLFDSTGVKVWLQVESGNANIDTLIDLVMERYGHHECVIGFGVDAEWYHTSAENNYAGRKITDEEAQKWEEHVKEYDENYTLTLKHWETAHMPPTYRGDIIYISDSQDFPNFDSMVNEFIDWGNYFSDNPVIYQVGYDSDVAGDSGTDKDWWANFDDPAKKIGQKFFDEIDNCMGIYWVDFTIKEVFPPDEILQDYVKLSVEDGEIKKGTVDTFSVELDLKYDSSVDSIAFDLTNYCPKIRFQTISLENTLAGESQWNTDYNEGQREVAIEMAGANIEASGVLLNIVFKAIGNVGDVASVEVDNLYISGEDSVEIENGEIQIIESDKEIIERVAGISSPGEFSDNLSNDPDYWADSYQHLADNFNNATPAGSWKVCDYLENGQAKLSFQNPTGKDYENITFSEEDKNQEYFSTFSNSGVKVWLLIEPGDANVDTLINLVLNEYGNYESTMGIGIAGEYINYGTNNGNGKVITDAEAERWETLIKEYNDEYSLTLLHWNKDNMPPNYKGELIFVDNSSDLSDLDAMTSEFQDWGSTFAPNRVIFQVGYDSDWSGDGKTDKDWWSTYANPVKTIGDSFFENIDNCFGIYWIDKTKSDILPDSISTGITEQSKSLVKSFKLYENYPNPFNPDTNIKFDIIKSGKVKLTIYNLQGEIIKTLVNKRLGKGHYKLKCNMQNYSSGVYFYRIQTANKSEVNKMILLK